MALRGRKATVLRIIVQDYIAGAAPVASKVIVDKHGLEVSPATIRNDIACLEEEGYITHPHHSAGSVPTDKAYRYYVESLGADIELSLDEQYLIYHLLRETREEVEQWLELAVAWLAHFVRNLALVTSPRATCCRLKHLDLVALQDFIALLILVLYGAKVKQQVLSFDKRITQEELTKLANKLTSIYDGMTSDEILSNKAELSPEEKQVSQCLARMMAEEDKLEYGKPYLEGLHLMLSQPEFANNPKALNILEMLERENWLRRDCFAPLAMTPKRKVKVIIGEENPEPSLQSLSMIISPYGIPGKASGIIGVLGPKRMDYARAISSLNSLSTLLSDSIASQW